MREETVTGAIRACKSAGRPDLVSALRSGALTAAEVQRRLSEPQPEWIMELARRQQRNADWDQVPPGQR